MWTTFQKQRIQKFKEAGDSRYIDQNELDKACFWHNMAHGYFSNLPRATASEKILHDEALVISKYPKYYRYQQGLAVTVSTFFWQNVCHSQRYKN